jgi:hypothetical protein
LQEEVLQRAGCQDPRQHRNRARCRARAAASRQRLQGMLRSIRRRLRTART